MKSNQVQNLKSFHHHIGSSFYEFKKSEVVLKFTERYFHFSLIVHSSPFSCAVFPVNVDSVMVNLHYHYLKICPWNLYTSQLSSIQLSALIPAFIQVFSKNSSMPKAFSVATCGSNRPLEYPF